jgi:hypothetical protein
MEIKTSFQQLFPLTSGQAAHIAEGIERLVESEQNPERRETLQRCADNFAALAGFKARRELSS